MRDSDVRAALRKSLHSLHNGDADTKIVEEMGVWSGSVRIDVAVINGELSGFELKSDRDTLARLPLQSDLYSRVFDRLHLVVGARHAAKATQLVPEWWGIYVARECGASVELSLDREPRLNPNPDPFLVAQLLWKPEAIIVLAAHGLADGWRSKRARAVHRRLAEELPFDVLRKEVRLALKKRDGWLGQSSAYPLDVTVHA